MGLNLINNALSWLGFIVLSHRIALSYGNILPSVLHTPFRVIYIANRTKCNFYAAIEKQNKIARDHKPTKNEQEAFLISMKSYLGIMKHYKTYRLRKKLILDNVSGWWWNYIHIVKYEKLIFNKKIVKNRNVYRR